MKKTVLFLSIVLLTVLGGVTAAPDHAYACDTLEQVTVDGITYNRVRSTPEPCATATPAPTAPAPVVAKPQGLVLPAFTTGGTAATPAGGGSASASGTAGGSGKSASNLSVASQLDCGDPSTSGTLGEAFSGFLSDIGSRIGSDGLSSVFSGLGRSGEAGSVISDIFRSGAGSALNSLGSAGTNAAGNYVSDQIQGAFGDSRLGQAAGRIVGNAAGQVVQNVGQNVISNIGSQFGLGQSGGVGGSVAELFGGSGAGGAIGSLAGGVIGKNVPVDDSAVKAAVQQADQNITDKSEEIRALAQTLDERSAITLRRECVTKQAALRLVSEQVAKNAADTIQNTSELIVQDRSGLQEKAANSAAKNYIDSIQDSDVRQTLTAFETKNQNPTTLATNCGQGQDIFSRILHRGTNTNCGKQNQIIKAYSDLQAVKETAAAQAEQQVSESGGLRPDGTCQGAPSASFEECQKPNIWITNVPATLAKDQLSQALSAPQNRLINTHDTGEIISDAFNDLLNEVFSTIGDEIQGGIRGLSNRLGGNSNNRGSGSGFSNSGSGFSDTGTGFGNGGTTSGSYLDQLTGDTLTPSDRSDLVSQNIANAASIESAYRSTLEQMITNLRVVSNMYAEVHSCYQTLALGSPTSITQAEAQTRANTASTTVNAVFISQINDRTAEMNASISTASRLTILANQAGATTDPADLAALASAYQTLVDAHETHTTADLQILVNNMQLDASALQVLGEDATSQATQCRATH